MPLADSDASVSMTLNRNGMLAAESLLADAVDYRVAVHSIEGGGRFVDCGIEAKGGLLAGIELARICLGGLGQVSIVPGELGERAIPLVQVVTDHPVRACLASQYAGWALKEGKFFAMGSGPMRAAAGSEAIFDVIGFRETAEQVIGVLETRKPPPPAIVAKIAQACRVEPAAVTLLAAPDGQPGRRSSNRRPLGGDGIAQAGRAQVRSLADRLGLRHGPACRRLPPTTWPPSGGPMTRSCTGRGWSWMSPATMRASKRSARRCHRRPRATTASRLRRSSRGTTTISTRSTLTCSARPRSRFQNIETGKVHTFGQVTPGILARSFGI